MSDSPEAKYRMAFALFRAAYNDGVLDQPMHANLHDALWAAFTTGAQFERIVVADTLDDTAFQMSVNNIVNDDEDEREFSSLCSMIVGRVVDPAARA